MTCSFAALRRPFSIAVFAVTSAASGVSPLLAQSVQLVQSIPDPNDPVERLGRYIRILAASPRALDALLGAGQAALDVGDANAALGFFARAEEVAPSSGQVKAGLGSSLVMIERPDDALRLFAEAVAHGVPESAVARDRGLAYDLRGDSRRAQRDYALAMTRQSSLGPDDELLRRYALSLGISGDRAAALTMIDPLLRKQDQGAWRARAFIMAMNGDVSGANGVARQLMMPAMASAMAPLLSRLAMLNAAERAHAVNFGTIPADGTQLAVQTGDPFLGAVPRSSIVSGQGLARTHVVSGDTGLIPAGEPLGPRPVEVKPTRTAMADSYEARRRPGPEAVPATGAAAADREVPPKAAPAEPSPNPGFSTAPGTARRVGERIGTRIGDVRPLPDVPATNGQPSVTPSAGTPTTSVTRPQPTPVLQTPPSVATQAPAPEIVTAAPGASPSSLIGPPADPAVTVSAQAAVPSPVQPVPTSSVPTSSVTAAPASRLAGLLDGIEREQESAVVLPNTAELRAARAAARKKVAQLAAQAAAEEADKREKAEKAVAAKRNPPRIWVQVATGRNDSGLGITLKRIRSDNEAALKGVSGWSAPYKATNRILVGPMKSAAAARDLVAKLGKNGVSAMTFNSDAGEEVEKISGK